MKIISCESKEFAAAWNHLWNSNSFQHALYTPMQASFYEAYWETSVFENVSFVIIKDGEPVCGVLMAWKSTGNLRELSYYGLPVFWLSNPSVTSLHSQNLYRLMKAHIEDLVGDDSSVRIIMREPELQHELTMMGRILLERGGRIYTHATQMIDLTLETPELKKELRKSYRSLISWGEKNLQIAVVNEENVDSTLMASFRELHVRAAGRETRPKASWDAQEAMIASGEAFAVYAWMDGELVSAALFPHSTLYCYYGVSASDRSLGNKPLSHAVLWRAIHHAKHIGCKYFEMGDQCYYIPPDVSEQLRKEYNISKFKRGFGGYPKMITEIVVSPSEKEGAQ